MKKTQKIANGKEYGVVEFGGNTYILTQQAYCDNYGTDGGVRYYAHAVSADDADMGKYKVVWATTPEWDNHQKGGSTHPKETDNEGHDIYPNDETCDFCEDESNACDWDSPVDVVVID